MEKVAVIAGDIHYNLSTLSLADKGIRQAISLANKLNVPFISNGDMLDQKALMRAEYVNAIIETFKLCKLKPYVNVGNHSRINHNGFEHALNFLRPYAHVIDTPTYIQELNSYIIPYNHDSENLRSYLKTLPKGSRLIMHQGVNTALAGEYIHDKSAIDAQDLADFRTILSHYHTRQDIKCGRPRQGAVGLASYIGNLFTLNYAEAKDPEKGFQILMDDGTLEFVPTNLRKHVVLEMTAKEAVNAVIPVGIRTDDLVWCKVSGTKEQLSKVNKQKLETMLNNKNIRLEFIPTDEVIKVTVDPQDTTTLLNVLIDAQDLTLTQKQDIKQLWSKLQE